MSYIVYSKENCPQCDSVKRLLQEKDIAFSVMMLGSEDTDTTYTRETLLELAPFARALPQVFENGVLIGGLSAVKEALTRK